MSRPINETRRFEIESLTWLRGLAALVVVVSHSLRALEVRYHSQDELPGFNILNAFVLGSLGVALFFARQPYDKSPQARG